MRSGGILGCHCSFQYPETEEGTYFYERYPRTLKGVDAVIFAVFRAFGLAVHIKPYDWRVEMVNVKTRHQILLSAAVTTGGEPAVNNKELERFWTRTLCRR